MEVGIAEEADSVPVLSDEVLIEGHSGLLAEILWEHTLYAGDAKALFQGADHDEVGEVDTGVAFFNRRGHNLHPDVVIDNTGGNHFFLAIEVERGEVAVQEEDDLIHIEVELREVIPIREVKFFEFNEPFPEPLSGVTFSSGHDSIAPFTILYKAV